MTEESLYEQVAKYLAYQHPELAGMWHFDLSGVWTPSHKARNLYARLNQRAWPDLFLPVLRFMPGTVDLYGGLFIELKKEGTRLRKRDGSYASPHIEEQAAMLDKLAKAGYCAVFACGLDAAIEAIESYLNDGVVRQLEAAA